MSQPHAHIPFHIKLVAALVLLQLPIPHFSPNAAVGIAHLLPLRLSYGVLPSCPTLNLDSSIAAHRTNHCIIAQSIFNFSLIFVSTESLITLAMSRMDLPASSTAPLLCDSPLGGFSGTTFPPILLATSSTTATIEDSPSVFMMRCPPSPPRCPHARSSAPRSDTIHVPSSPPRSPLCATTLAYFSPVCSSFMTNIGLICFSLSVPFRKSSLKLPWGPCRRHPA